MAWCGAFSGTSRPDHTAGPPPGPGTNRAMSTPLWITSALTAWDHAWAVLRLTATKVPASRDSWTADSSQGTGGVCNVVTSGAGRKRAMATGRW
jgi:hypothetical protein